MTQKIIQIGNSAGLIIPQSLRDKVGLELGDEVIMEYVEGSEEIVISKKGSKHVASPVSPHFLQVLEKVNKQYGVALKELAGK